VWGSEPTVSRNLSHAGILAVAKTGTSEVVPAPGRWGEDLHNLDLRRKKGWRVGG